MIRDGFPAVLSRITGVNRQRGGIARLLIRGLKPLETRRRSQHVTWTSPAVRAIGRTQRARLSAWDLRDWHTRCTQRVYCIYTVQIGAISISVSAMSISPPWAQYTLRGAVPQKGSTLFTDRGSSEYDRIRISFCLLCLVVQVYCVVLSCAFFCVVWFRLLVR